MTHSMPSLFSSIKAGALTWPNRILMAPLTRGRAEATGIPTAMMAEYYRLRANAGLIIAEATAISQQGYGWVNAPGIFIDAHEKGWKKVTDAVHQAGGHIYLQLWHMGRISHPDFQNGRLPVAPSAIAATGQATTPLGKKPYVVPHPLTIEEIAAIVQDYIRAARRAISAGFDGVEIHSANGYLLDEFLRDGSNKRTDNYGGSLANRTRFLREVVEAVTATVGADKAGVRLSPKNPNYGMSDSDPESTFTYAAEMLNEFSLAYLHVREDLPGEGKRVSPSIRKVFKGVFVANGGYDQKAGELAIENGEADAIAYGRPFIANADLVKRFKIARPLNTPDPNTFYTPGREGYLDYPLLGTETV